MPERRRAWDHFASKVSGSAFMDTRLTSSVASLSGEYKGLVVHARGTSYPYNGKASATHVWLEGRQPFEHRLLLNREGFPLFDFWKGRDIVLGTTGFDDDWLVRSNREPLAQAFLGERLVNQITAIPSEWVVDRESFFRFELSGRTAHARSVGFEMSVNRFSAVVEVLHALATRPDTLLDEWSSLSSQLDGRFERGTRFRPDGSVRINVRGAGGPLVITPQAVRAGWRSKRLRTRVVGERQGGERRRFAVDFPRDAEGDELISGVAFRESIAVSVSEEDQARLREALVAARPVAVTGSRSHVHVDLDGNVLDPERVRAALRCAEILSGSRGAAGPFR